LITTLFILTGTSFLADAADRRPNVVVVMADDISARDFPIYGSSTCYGERAETPVIDRLAKEGCYLTTAWSSTVCMPTRAMVMSGRYAHLTKWWDLTKQADRHRDWIYGYKGNRQMVRGHHLMRDGKGAWWDVSKVPSDLDSFPEITDLNSLSDEQQKEKELIEQVLARFARADVGGPHSFHADPSRELSERKKEKMRAKREQLEKHLNTFK
jgi:hypothetical protein